VLASDIDVSWMTRTDQPTYEIRRHNSAPKGRHLAGSTWCTHAWCLPTLRGAPRRWRQWSRWYGQGASGGGRSGLATLVCDEYGPEQQLANQINTDSAP
jgi:hypothetical protein